MKKVIKILIFACVFLFSCDNTENKATQYNDKVIDIQTKADSILTETLKSFENQNKQDILISYELNRDKTVSLIEKAEELEPINGSKKYKTALWELLNKYFDLYENQIAELVDIYIKNPEEITETDFAILESCYKELNQKYDEAGEEFLKAQKKFAEEHNLQLE